MDYEIAKIQSFTLQEKCYEGLLEAIVRGRIPPGQPVTISGLAKMLNVSLTPVRFALQKLAGEGFLEISKNRRTQVVDLNVETLQQIKDIRLVLECHAAEIACQSRTDYSLIVLQDLFDKCNAAEEIETYLSANQAFHLTLYREAQKPILLKTIESFWQRMSPYFHVLFVGTHEWKNREFIKRHQGILQAMQRKDPRAMRHWLSEDLNRAANLICEKIEQRCL